ncbi:MAG: Gfo/Idh/MocA family oxidoreductase [Candidatus Hydrogenedentota bacterium]
MEPVKVGLIGCGNISETYFKNGALFNNTEIVACADIIPERAEASATEYAIPKVYTVEEMLADPDIELVLNLTVPKAHGSLGMAALDAGKCLYNEKPLAVTREDGKRMVALAKEKGVLLGAAPDTFMGAGLQTCRKLIDDGWIGEPVAATAFMQCHGHEHWHPDPDFFYQAGGGPMFDMGPYYVTALVALMGPVKRVAGTTRTTFSERSITSEPRFGEIIKVNTATHLAGTMDFANGAIATLVMSFDVWGHHLPCIEIHGTEGSLSVPDPNGFGGVVQVCRPHMREWAPVPLTHRYAENSRGIGPADMACALRTGRRHRANEALAYHVLDVMHAFQDSSDRGIHVLLESTCKRPAPLPMNPRLGEIDR